MIIMYEIWQKVLNVVNTVAPQDVATSKHNKAQIRTPTLQLQFILSMKLSHSGRENWHEVCITKIEEIVRSLLQNTQNDIKIMHARIVVKNLKDNSSLVIIRERIKEAIDAAFSNNDNLNYHRHL